MLATATTPIPSFEMTSAHLREPNIPAGVLTARSLPDVSEVFAGPEGLKTFIRNTIVNEQRDEAFFVVDLGNLYRQKQRWSALLPRVQPFYAVKCNPDRKVVEYLSLIGVNFDCASRGEMQLVTSLGVDPSRIIFANPTKMPAHIKYAREIGVKMMTFDNIDELRKIKTIHPDAELVLRVMADDSRARNPFSTKFGAPASACPALLNTAAKLGLNIIGVSFHVGSGCLDAEAYADALRVARHVFDLAETYGYTFRLLDIGGGFPGHDEDKPTFGSIATVMQPVIDQLFPPSVAVIAEPGRYFASNTSSLVCSVIARRTRYSSVEEEEEDSDRYDSMEDEVMDFDSASLSDDSSHYESSSPLSMHAFPVAPEDACGDNVLELLADHSEPKHETRPVECPNEPTVGPILTSTATVPVDFLYYVNDGVYGSFNCLLYDHAIIRPIPLLKANGQRFSPREPLRTCTMFGPTCDSLDCILKGGELPLLNIGDWLMFERFGAYTNAASSEFNGFTLPKKNYVFTHL